MPDALETQVLEAIRQRRDRIIDLARELVSIRSVNPRYPDANYEEELGGETRCNDVLERIYADAGFEITRVAVEEGRSNLVARLPGSSGGHSLAFNGHVDTVAAGDTALWNRHPWSAEADGDRLHGLGSADMKGPIAAYTIACCTLAELDIPLAGDLVAQCVCGEETGDDSVGTTACLKDGAADFGICAEPTGAGPDGDMTIAPVSLGTLLLRIEVDGKSVHAGRRREAIYPVAEHPSGVSAADKGLKLVAALARLESGWGMGIKSRFFEKGQFTINLGAIDSRARGAGSAFFLPDTFTADFAVYYAPERESAEVRDEIERCLMAEAALDNWLAEHPPRIEWTLDMPPARKGADSEIHRVLEAAVTSTGNSVVTNGFTAGCDATWMDRGGIPTVIFGPGDLADAHRPNESVRIDHLVKAAEIYALAALNLCRSKTDVEGD